jgi:hypothetical protein
MSNDARFWLIRILLFTAIGIDSWFMTKMGASAFGNGKHTTFWAIAFFVSMILTLPLGFLAFQAKKQRWEKAKPMDRVEVETLANYAKYEYTSKRPNRGKKRS